MSSLKLKNKMWRVFDQQIGKFIYFFVRCENFALYQNERLLRADPFCCSVIKEFAHAFSVRISSYGCTWKFRYTHAKHEKILKCLRVCVMKKYTLNSRWLVVGLVTATKLLLSEERKDKHTLSCLANFLLKDVCQKLHSSEAKLKFLKGRSRWRISVRLT